MNNSFSKEQEHIAYFSMEVGISHSIPTYSGGLGILAGDTLKSFADAKLPVVGITLLNEKGYFHQHIDDEGNQCEEDVIWNPHEKLTLEPNKIIVHIETRPVTIQAWKHIIYSNQGHSIPVYFLDTNLPENNDYDKTLTSYLYGGDRRYRLCQEIILGIGGTRMLASLGYHNIKKYHMNEGHAALLTIELLKNVYENNIDAVRKKCVFTTHTPVAAGHDRFEIDLFKNVIGSNHLTPQIEEKISQEGKINMTLLGLHLSGHVNGVAKKHGEVTKHMFPGHQIDAITNGVHPVTWASEHTKKLFDKHIPEWRNDPYSLRNALSIPSEEIEQTHENAKKELIERVNLETGENFDHRRFTIGFARRFTAYKRPDLMLFDIARLKAIAAEVGDIQIIFAGKAHKQDYQGKEIIKRVWNLAKQINAENGKIKIVFMRHYDMLLAKMMVSGCDVWLNNPQRPYEASGTSGMKAAINGVPQISTLDGWWLEGHVEDVTGWRIGPTPGQAGFDNDYSPDDEAEDLYRKLKEKIIPTYYGNKHEWNKIMKHCIAINGSFFNSYRMVQQYIATTYRD
jgi:starch phosphorylase